MIDDALLARAERLIALCRVRFLTLATAESCTGGLVAAALTAIPGSSDVVDCGFVTYSNDAKTAMLGVPAALIARHGAVSEVVARAMAEGALGASKATLTVSITGIAGPGGGSPAKPVGLVHFGCATRGVGVTHAERRFGDVGRAEVRRVAVLQAFAMLEEAAIGFTP